MSKAFDVKIAPRTLLEKPTVAGIASSLQQAHIERESDVGRLEEVRSEVRGDWLRFSAVDEVAVFPCLPVQIGLLSQGFAAEGTRYVHQFTFTGRDCSANDLHRACLATIQALEIFRISFHTQEASQPWLLALHSDCAIIQQKCVTLSSAMWPREEVQRAARQISSCDGSPAFRMNVFGNASRVGLQLIMHHA
jgi:hypothetical protein